MTACTNCRRPVGTNGARGLCARCYQYARRNRGALPPAELLTSTEGRTVQLSTRVTPPEHQAVEAAARKAGVSVSDWLRACAVELGLAHN